ncbi:MAG TPA: hypothetical protein VLC46_20360 [Thermoanaerobaculia bacterium]|nr:hypothetical protein [Thermoanaerobaculia bacterium]
MTALVDQAMRLLEPSFLREQFTRGERFVISLIVNKFLALEGSRTVLRPEDIFGQDEPATSAKPKQLPARSGLPTRKVKLGPGIGPRCENVDRHRLRGAPPPALFCFVIDGVHHHVCGYHQPDDRNLDFTGGSHRIKNCPVANPPLEEAAQ